jgi:CubicO group peptidase (beta-lactamase class C family)
MNKKLSITGFCMAAIVTLFFVNSQFLHAQSGAGQLDARVNELIKDFDNSATPGGVIMVMRDGRVVYTKAFGMANLTHNIPYSASTRFNLGSTSKQFTAMAIAMLQQQGKLSIEDDVRKYFPELPFLGDTVRLRHLLSHTSGYREYINSLLMSGRHINDYIRPAEILMQVQNQPKLQNIPGETYNYNNTGYALLAMVVQRVTGVEFPVWMRENVFLPLGMNSTVVKTAPGQVIPGNAQGYTKTSDEKYEEVADLAAAMGPGGVYSTLDDLQKWIMNFHRPIVGDAALIGQIQTPFTYNNGEPMKYAWGLIVGDLKGLKMVEHGGADIAHRSMMMMFPEVKGAVLTQSNNSSFGNLIARKVAEAFFADVMTFEEEKDAGNKTSSEEFVYDVSKFDELAGRYELEVAPGFIMEFRREGDKLMTQATGQPSFELFASSDSTFYLKVVEAGVTFHRNEKGAVEQITLHQNGNHKANRVHEPAWKPSDEDIKMYVGRYFSPELEAIYNVALNDEGKLVLQHRRYDDFPINADSKDVFTASFPIPNLTFVRDENGVVTGFNASSGRSTDVLFEKQ